MQRVSRDSGDEKVQFLHRPLEAAPKAVSVPTGSHGKMCMFAGSYRSCFGPVNKPFDYYSVKQEFIDCIKVSVATFPVNVVTKTAFKV